LADWETELAGPSPRPRNQEATKLMGEAKRKQQNAPPPLRLDFVGRFVVTDNRPMRLDILGEMTEITPTVEIQPIYGADRIRDHDYIALAAANGARCAVQVLHVEPRIGFSAQIALFADGGPASFPALLLDDGRLLTWRNSRNEMNPSDRHPRREEMRELIEAHSTPSFKVQILPLAEFDEAPPMMERAVCVVCEEPLGAAAPAEMAVANLEGEGRSLVTPVCRRCAELPAPIKREKINAALKRAFSEQHKQLPIQVMKIGFGQPPLADMLDIALARAKDVMIAGQEELPATWVLRCADDCIRGVITDFRRDQKDHAATAMRRMMPDFGCSAYVFLAEAWAGEDENRVEVVVAHASDSDGERLTRVWDTIRDEVGHVIELKFRDESTVGDGGRFANLLQKPPTLQ
jgi:hypothetical protein